MVGEKITLRCPHCSAFSISRVTDSRPALMGRAIRRRRECTKCGERMTTYEMVDGQQQSQKAMLQEVDDALTGLMEQIGDFRGDLRKRAAGAR